MEHFTDVYGVRADQETFLKREEETIDRVAGRLMAVLDIEMVGTLSESRGGICWDIAWDSGDRNEDDGGEASEALDDLEDDVVHPSGLDVHLSPNRIIEPDDDYWREENYREFAWLLTVGSPFKARIEEVKRAIESAKDLNLTLIRSVYDRDLNAGGPGVVTFSLKPEAANDQGSSV